MAFFYKQFLGKDLIENFNIDTEQNFELDLKKYGKCYKIGFFINNESDNVDGLGHYKSWIDYLQSIDINEKFLKIIFNDEIKTISIGRTGIYEIHGDYNQEKYITKIILNGIIDVINYCYLDIYYEK